MSVNLKHAVVALIFVSACKSEPPKEYGSLSGNVFWKYNNYVGNRPDASADVTVFNLEDTTVQYSSKVDMRGDFGIDSVQAGKYLLVVWSKNTTDSYKEHFMNFAIYGRTIKKIDPGFDTSLVYKNFNHYCYLDSLQLSTWKSGDQLSWKIADKWRDSLESFSRTTILEELPKSNFPWALYVLRGKMEFKRIEIKPKHKEKVVVDFGVTYR